MAYTLLKNKEVIVFYSWMTDRPRSENLQYIRKKLSEDCKKLEKEFGLKIKIDTDSRGEDGSRPIEENVMKKINECALFVGDITPIYPRLPWLWWHKPTPNPNVLYELGYAVSSLGWNRCIMVWNSKYGKQAKAPFDIRNHTAVSYEKGKRNLALYSVLKTKIENYDEYVKDWRTNKERSFDAEKYNEICKICPERDLVDSIDKFLTNRVYNSFEFNIWDNLQFYYQHYPDNRFVDDELHHAYLAFLSELKNMTMFAAKYNEQIKHSQRLDNEVGTDAWRKEEIYKIRNPYDYLDEQKAAEQQRKIDENYEVIALTIMKSYKVFRDLIRKKLLV